MPPVYSAVLYNAVLYSVVLCSALLYSAVQRSTFGPKHVQIDLVPQPKYRIQFVCILQYM